MAINAGRVVLGGLVAGAIRTVGDGLTNTFVFASIYREEVGRINPALPSIVETTHARAGIVTINFLMGIALIYLYAAMFPRFGSRTGTAVRAGLIAWAIASLVWGVTVFMGFFSWFYLITRALVSLATVLLAVFAGASLYRDADEARSAKSARLSPTASSA